MKLRATLMLITSPIWVPVMMMLWLVEFLSEETRKRRSILGLALFTAFICAAMYSVAAEEVMSEQHLAKEQQQKRLDRDLAGALFAESHRRALIAQEVSR